MKSEDLNPPAIVKKHAEATDVLKRRVKELNGDLRHGERLNVGRFMDIARMLGEIKGRCKVGDWTKELEEMEVSKQDASWMLRALKVPSEQLAECQTITDLKDKIKTCEGGYVANADVPDKSGSNLAGEKWRCDRCVRLGLTGDDCATCKEGRAERSGRRRPPNGGQNEPGEDWQEDVVVTIAEEPETPAAPKPPKNGQVIIAPAAQVDIWFKASENSIGSIIRQYDDLVRPLGFLNTPAYNGVHRRLNELLVELKEIELQAKGLVKAPRKKENK